MSEDLHIITGSKTERYTSLLPQIKGLVEGETDLVANLANIAAALKEQFGWLWVGFYLVRTIEQEDGQNKEQLVVGPFQGPVACTRIYKGKGVCGTSWEKAQTIIVPDVEAFPGHIACSSSSKSEIVVPFFHAGKVAGVLDVDSERLNEFDEVDKRFLEEIAGMILLTH
ncbi:GAF domain-containing protein [Flavitalea flava]